MPPSLGRLSRGHYTTPDIGPLQRQTLPLKLSQLRSPTLISNMDEPSPTLKTL